MIQVENLNLRINSPFREQYRLRHQLLEQTTNYYTYYLLVFQHNFELNLLHYNWLNANKPMDMDLLDEGININGDLFD